MMNPVDELMWQAVESRIFPGAVLLAADPSGIRYQKAFGVTDLDSGQPVKPSTLFDLASLTKPLCTALVVMKLIQAGRLDLNQGIGTYVPMLLETDKSRITIDHLLRHTSGLPAHREYYRVIMKFPEKSRREMLRSLVANEPLLHEPGVQKCYSDLGFILLAWIIETVAEQRLDLVVQEMIYRPLGIHDLIFIEIGDGHQASDQDDNAIASTERCPWRGRVLRGEVHDDNAWAAGGIEGHAGLFGTAQGVWKLLTDILKASARHESVAIPVEVLESYLKRKSPEKTVAGFDTVSPQGSSAGSCFSPLTIGHLGFTGTSFWLDLEKQRGVILLTNRVHPSRTNEGIKAFRPRLHDQVMTTLFK